MHNFDAKTCFLVQKKKKKAKLFTSHSDYEHCAIFLFSQKREEKLNMDEETNGMNTIKKNPVTASENCTDERCEEKKLLVFLLLFEMFSRKRERDRPNYTRNG